MKKIIFILSIFFSFTILNADYLLANKNYCINDYWYQKVSGSNYFYYVRSDNGNTYRTTAKNYELKIFSGFDYNSTSYVCSKKPILMSLGLTNEMYYGLMAFVGVLLGFLFLFFGVYIVIDVAKK